MLIATLIMAAIAIALTAVAIARADGSHAAGLRHAGNMTLEVLPMVIFAFVIAGMIQVLLPPDLVSRWVGMESGLRGIAIGTLAGAITPGGPYVSLPVVAGLLKAGASPGTMVAFLTSWSLWAVARLPMEFAILGWRFTLLRLAAVVVFPPIAGWLALRFSHWFGLGS
ncbi:MAG: permease [Acidobacteriota bacterium]|jgi:uncharacterized membrane protein YraQ (UPF0718 family)|nr:permease [Acidobacteriota bacterium]